jgi:hypothetical protein
MQKMVTPLMFLLCALWLWGCKSAPREEDIPSGLSSAELIQLAQTSFDEGNTPASELYYRVLAARFYDDLPVRLAAEYELVHIKIKQKKWDEALPILTAILEYYDGSDGYSLPQAYYKLAVIDMNKIPEKYREESEVQ